MIARGSIDKSIHKLRTKYIQFTTFIDQFYYTYTRGEGVGPPAISKTVAPNECENL